MFVHIITGLSLASFAFATFPAYDPQFPKLGFPGDGDPVYGNHIFVTGVTYEGFTSATPGITAQTLKECLDDAAGNKKNFNMFVWDNLSLQCLPIDTRKVLSDVKELKVSRMDIRVPLRSGFKEINQEFFYFPATEKTKTADFSKKSLKGAGAFNTFMDGCDIGLENWVTIDGEGQRGWTQITYPRKASSVLIFSTIKKKSK